MYFVFLEGRLKDLESTEVMRLPNPECTEFKKFVRAKFGNDFKKGHYMEELRKAILMYMRTERSVGTHTHAQEKISLIPKRIVKGSDKMLDYLVGNYRYEPGKGVINFQHLKNAIKFAFGSDERTFDKYRLELKRYGIVRPHGETFQFMPLVLEPESGRPIECSSTNEKIEGEILSAVVKAEDEEKKKENEANLVLAKFGDLR